MSGGEEPFGARLYAELRKLSGYNVITGMLDYKTIQHLKQADRDTTVAIFARSSDEVVQQLRAKEPEEVARYLVDNAYRATVENANRAADDGSSIFIMISLLNSG
ncbi:MAG: hypothetical protein J5I93_06685 [Pirellulaceae bacterium]|nr:hypothetical protein [Pirellulaceae bacterium]